MSFLRGGSSAPSSGVNPDKIELAITEYDVLKMYHSSADGVYRLDTVTDFFNRMVQLVERGVSLGYLANPFVKVVSQQVH